MKHRLFNEDAFLDKDELAFNKVAAKDFLQNLELTESSEIVYEIDEKSMGWVKI